MKIVINTCYGGFGISKEAAQWMAERGDNAAIRDLASEHFYGYGLNEDRTNPLLIEAIETLGALAVSGNMSALKVVEIPDGVSYEIADYDGCESIHEVHREWS